MTVLPASTIFRDKVVDGVYSSEDHDPVKAEIREWAAWVEGGLIAGTLNGPWEASVSALNAKLNYAAGNAGFVYEGSGFGTYRKSGASGSGSWVKILDTIPGYQVVKAINAGAGTANAIVATSAPPVSYSDGMQIIGLNIKTTNTSENVTVNFNGLGTLAIKTASNNNPAVGGLVAPVRIWGQVDQSGTVFRMISDQTGAAIQAAAEAALADFRARWVGDFANDAAADSYLTTAGLTKLAGTAYFNTASDVWKYWDGDSWETFPYATVADGSVTEQKVASRAITVTKFGNDARAAIITNAIRGAEGSFAGVAMDGRGFVDLLCSGTTLDLAGSSNYQFRRGGMEPSRSVGTAADAAYGALSGSNSGWQLSTMGVTIASANLANTGKKWFRATFRSGTGGIMHIHGAFVGVIDADNVSFKKSFPVVPLLFAGAADKSITSGAATTTDWAEFEIPAGEKVGVFWYNRTVSTDLRYLGAKTQTGWTTYHKVANEPAKLTKSGYSSTGTALGLERIEVADNLYANMSLLSAELPLSSVPNVADVVAFLDCDSGDVGDITISLSRDGATWKTLTLGALYNVNGKIGRVANAVDLTTGAGSGSSLYWRAVTANNKRIKLNAVGIMQGDGLFTDVPSVDMRESDPVVSHHFEGTGLGVGTSGVSYGRLWGFTQDWVRDGPTRYRVRFHCNITHNGGAVAADPVAWSLAMTKIHGADLSALGAKDYTEADTTPATGNNSLKWIGFDSGNIVNEDEHYKTAYITVTVDVEDDGADRFEVWGYSETSADSGVSGNISVNHEEFFGVSLRELKYNKLEITAQPLR